LVFPALQAQLLTSNSTTFANESDVQLELTLAENQIQVAGSLGQYFVLYNATIIGNPLGDPNIPSNLTVNQQTFYNLFINAGYQVYLDFTTGWWNFTWALTGPEATIVVYTFRTTFVPTSIINTTISTIEAYFASLIPIVHTTTTYNGFINEAGFGGATSTYYEFTIAANQGTDTTDHSVALKAFILIQGLGYNSGNCNAYQLIA
jgi:hypothetical protein